MILQADQKFIDASHVAHLLTAGEKYADRLTFSVDRQYHGKDLAGCLFVIRGVNSAGNLSLQTLSQETTDTAILLTWNISPAFTAVSGILALEIVCYDEDNMILKYTVTPMQVRESVLEEYSGGVDAIEEALKEMEQILEETRSISVKLPIIKDGTWWLYNTDSGAYEDSGQPAQGPAGQDGRDGADGVPGKDGTDGVPGADGLDGADGKSAYEIWLDAGNVGTEADFLASLKGDTGEIPDTSEILEAAQNAESVANSVRADLVNYYRKSETYTQEEVNQLISAIPKFAIAVVSALPTSEISPTTVYLLKSGSETDNLYTEYIYVNSAWETLGAQKMDLSGYYTSAQTDALLDDKVDKADGMGLSANNLTDALLAKLNGVENGANKTIIDTDLDESSDNAIANRAVAVAIALLQAVAHTHDNQSVLDSITAALWAQVTSSAHSHNNINLLNSISPGDLDKLRETLPSSIYELQERVDNCLPLSGGTMDTNSKVTIPGENNRSTSLTRAGIRCDVAANGGWFQGIAYYDATDTTALCYIGAYGIGDELKYICLGGMYNDPLVKIMPDGTIICPNLSDSGWITCTLGSFATSGTIKYRIVGKQIAVYGSQVVLAKEAAMSPKAPQSIASCTYDFTNIKNVSGIGRWGSYAGIISLAKYNGSNIIHICGIGSAIPAETSGDFYVTGFID
ncbi:hypothetical protein [Ruminococcus sp.]|uniref:hypothetical protein n=1 Tax=Ruminococcus sp. TaxID=41978 RepID=UPI0025F0FB60|nr:hypothetical protein [Ruminococcus sp.]